MKYKDFTLAYGGAGLYHASLTDDPEYGTPFVVSAPTDEKAWEKLRAMIDAESCGTCGKHMKDEEHNYGTEDILTCIHCYDAAQTNPAKEFVSEVNKLFPGTFPPKADMDYEAIMGDIDTFNSEDLAA